MKSKKSLRVKAERGYGPRHMMNAQEGSEAVPSPLPSVPEVAPDRATLLMREIIRQAREGIGMSPEQVAEIRRNPLGAKALASYAQAGIMLMPEFGGEKPTRPLDPGAMAFEKKYGIQLYPEEPPQKPYDINKWQEQVGKGQGQYEEPPLPPEQDKRGKAKVGVAKGFGPAHAENSKEGDDLTQVNTDTVPAMLTPREAVLNRNAAELAGRGTIEKLNSEGNKLAKNGVDLAAGGMSDVKEEIMKSKPKQSKPAQSGSPYVQAFQNLMPKGGAPVGYQGGGGNVGGTDPMMPGMGGGLGARDQYGRQFSNRDASGGFASGNGVPAQPVVDPTPGGPYGTRNDTGPGVIGGPMGGGPFPGRGPGGVYPGAMPGMQGPGTPPTQQGPFPGRAPNGMYYQPQAQGLADGSSNVGPIGTPPQGEQAYGPPVNLTAPQIQQLAKQTGISPTQIMGLMKAFQGGKDIYNSVGTGGGYANQSPSAGEDFGNPNYIGLGTPSYQGGISDIGYPPFVAPSASYDGNRGGWLGPYDPSFMIQRYAGGTSYVSPFR